MEAEKEHDSRDLSCRLRCSERLKARLQYWHWYFFSGVFRVGVGAGAAALAVAAAAGMSIEESRMDKFNRKWSEVAFLNAMG